MKVLWCCVVLHTIFAQIAAEFGTSYFKNSRLCRQWNCINTKLGLPNSLPPREQYGAVLRSLLPQGAWQDTAEKVLDACYNNRQRTYTSTCPGQALMHCVLDNLIQNCPDDSWRKNDACTPVTSLAGFRDMFSQSRYEDLEKNLPTETRPTWYFKNYFSSKCCNLPQLFNSSVLSECDFHSLINYHIHGHYDKHPQNLIPFRFVPHTTSTSRTEVDKVKVVDISQNNLQATPDPNGIDHVNVVNLDDLQSSNQAPTLRTINVQNSDPLDCCDISGFIEPAWRAECDFQVTWDEKHRMSIKNTTTVVTTTEIPTTMRTVKSYDVKILPQTCDKETCVFQKLGVVSSSGQVDLDAFSKLLDNMTSIHTSWVKAKARVVTKCLSKPITDYVDDCEINRVLACSIDVLSENCPHARKHDSCKHSNVLNSDITCQISSSKYRPKNRRQFCGIPSIVSHEVLAQCGLTSLTHMEYVSDPVTSRPKTLWWNQTRFVCKGSTDSTKCLLKKMEVLNKYGFLDYFKMKDRIRMFTTREPVWSTLTDVYLNTFTGMPMYGEQCTTPKKLLNVLDSMIMTCPISKRKHSLQCNRILTDFRTAIHEHTLAVLRKKQEEQSIQAQKHFQHVYSPWNQQRQPVIHEPVVPLPVIPQNPMYSAILGLGGAPPVEIINLKRTTTRPTVLLPVYLRNKGTGSFSVRPYDGVLRSNPPTFNNGDPLQDADFIAM